MEEEEDDKFMKNYSFNDAISDDDVVDPMEGDFVIYK